jgi:hypothetical protein
MANLKKTKKKDIILKVHPVGTAEDSTIMPNPDVPAEWVFNGKEWKVPPDKETETSKWKIPPPWVQKGVSENSLTSRQKRKVLMVRYAGSKKIPNGGDGRFLIDIPEGFFDAEGNFTARPLYQSTDTLHVLWTGTEAVQESGWIDLNYQERGGNGGGDSTTTVGCAKWS